MPKEIAKLTNRKMVVLLDFYTIHHTSNAIYAHNGGVDQYAYILNKHFKLDKDWRTVPHRQHTLELTVNDVSGNDDKLTTSSQC